VAFFWCNTPNFPNGGWLAANAASLSTLEIFNMKKTLIALAALAAGAAFAQSSVTIYGKVDAGVFKSIGSNTTELGEASGSRVGFMGSEDLGGGLKANFKLETRLKPDTGAANANFWNGTSIVGVSGAFGSVDLGRTYSAAFNTAAAADVFGWDGVAQNTTASRAGTSGALRFGNGVFYTSPNFSGFTAKVSYALKETTGANNGTSLNLAYANGPISASIGTEKNIDGNKYQGVAAAYDFGVAKAFVLLAKGEVGAVDNKSTVVGVTVPMGAATLKASYARMKSDDTTTISQLGLGARYALSKRTDLYTSYARNNKAAAEKSGYEFGMTHNF
jgi:predicted porin